MRGPACDVCLEGISLHISDVRQSLSLLHWRGKAEITLHGMGAVLSGSSSWPQEIFGSMHRPVCTSPCSGMAMAMAKKARPKLFWLCTTRITRTILLGCIWILDFHFKIVLVLHQCHLIPSKWSTANVSPVFKKGKTCLPGNNCPISLTCVPCKLMEHIICHHIQDHLDNHKILSPFQHGFRAKYYCETQLVTTLHDLFRTRDFGVELYVTILDFSRAFDKVPHRRLLNKLQHYVWH